MHICVVLVIVLAKVIVGAEEIVAVEVVEVLSSIFRYIIVIPTDRVNRKFKKSLELVKNNLEA